ncbi:MAG TPA: metal-dependent hydrolase [Thermodesulfobacteriota bacterium]|nr:metal-dependent hydrolase [Thermodesulfobacteriota bacterium]HNU72455.1 metal-dependent hydrolase [Thermodesulfobacteriota bacterium]HQO77813.1 metal-dependent hydrolase [Thermodesulfobacteriota bacterium]
MAEAILNNGISITYLGHACFSIVSQDTSLLIDPWITGNPQAPESAKDLAKPDAILITHAHGDHLGDALSIAKRTGASTVSMPEIAHYLVRKGLAADKAIGMNKGGTVTVRDARVTMVHALHSSSLIEDNQVIYGGEAAGFIILFKTGFSLYHAGDTGVFGDMKIIGEMYRPEVALVPIGDHYVMGPSEAAYACKLLKPKLVIPMHYGTFSVLTGTPEKFQALMQELPEIKILVLKPGEAIS